MTIMTHNEMFGGDKQDQEIDDTEMERLGPINPIFVPEENYSICARCRHEIMVTADGSHYCACNGRDLYEKFGVPYSYEAGSTMEAKERTISKETLFDVYDAALNFLGSFDNVPSLSLDGDWLEIGADQLKSLQAFESHVKRAMWEEDHSYDDEAPF